MFSFLSFCYKLKSLYIGLALVISYNHRCIHWKILSALWAQHSVWRIWTRDRKPTTWSSRSLSSLWSGSGCILGWFHSPADIEAPTPIPPLHTNSSIQAVLARCPRPTAHSLSWHCLPRACLLHRVHVTDWLSSPATHSFARVSHWNQAQHPICAGQRGGAKVTCVVSGENCLNPFPFALGPGSNWWTVPDSHKEDKGGDGQKT